VIPHHLTGKLPENLPLITGHTAAVLDTDFNPFNDTVIASASEDTNVSWSIEVNQSNSSCLGDGMASAAGRINGELDETGFNPDWP
jgi:hypothetical protein